jgi:hypothetical protein
MGRRMRAIAAIVWFAALTIAPSAQGEPAAMFGAGAQTCAQFAQHYRRSPSQSEDMYFSWAQGFMSSLNMVNPNLRQPRSVRDLAAWSVNRQQFYLRDYCDQHPLTLFAAAVIEMFKLLPVIPPQSN